MAQVWILCLVALFLGVPVHAETPAEAVKSTVSGTVEIRQETQRQEDRWAAEKAGLEARYRSTKSHNDALEKQTALWQQKVDVLQGQVDELERRIEESDRLEANLHKVLEEVMNRLEEWVQQDLPFLSEERAHRLGLLEESLAKTDSSGAEKLRTLLEALLVECEYGDTVEVYEQRIQVEGEAVFANIFRLGRLSIFWRTLDGERVGEYDRVSNRWVELPKKYARGISAAVDMAEKRRPVELLRLPVGRMNP